MSRNFIWLFFLVGMTIPTRTMAQAGATLKKIKAANSLSCGSNIDQPEYSLEDAHGSHIALDQDICKALAVAVLGASAKVTVVSYRVESEALKALKAGDVDVLATATPNFINIAKGSFGFARPVYYDYQGFLVDNRLRITSPRDLAGRKICFLGGTELEAQLEGYMLREKIKWLPFAFSEEGEMEAAFVTGNCAAISADISQLSYERTTFKNMARFFDILPDVIAKDPLAPAYRLGDPQWAAIVDWTIEALIQAEESGVTQANVEEMKKSDDLVIRRLLGVQRGYGPLIGLDDAWAARIIQTVGNYGEIFERDLGSGSPRKLPRGPNNLWTQGGLMYALPIR